MRLSPFACALNVRRILVWNYKKFRSNLEKIIQIPFGIWIIARRKGFEPLTFWSVGCLKGKLEPFWLQLVLFTTVRSANFPLFLSRPPRSNSVLGQKWVKKDFIITNWN